MENKSGKKPAFAFLVPACCPWCGSADFKKDGIRCGRQRFRCEGCHRTFTATTGTMLAKTRKRQELWEDFVIQFTNDATLIASHEYSSVNKNTAHLWRIKIMKCLGKLVSETVLSGKVWIDEIYFNVPEKDRIKQENGLFLHGISRNKLAVEIAIDSHGNTYAAVMGTGKPTSIMIVEALRGHVAEGSLIIHDNFHGHQDFIKSAKVAQVSIGSQKPGYKKLMQNANQFCSLIKRVFELHLGVGQDHVQDYLDWACFRQRLRSIDYKKRKKYVLAVCAGTGVDYKRPRKKKSAHHI